MAGRAGRVRYDEAGAESYAFECELGAGNTLLIVVAPSSAEWSAALPWAAGRRQEVLDRLASEIVRQKAPGASHAVHEGGVDILAPQRGDSSVTPTAV